MPHGGLNSVVNINRKLLWWESAWGHASWCDVSQSTLCYSPTTAGFNDLVFYQSLLTDLLYSLAK